MGQNADGDVASVKSMRTPAQPSRDTPRTPHQIRIERLFKRAARASIAGKPPPRFHDATLFVTNIGGALTAWKMTALGCMQRVALQR